jgi:hypothetical protein
MLNSQLQYYGFPLSAEGLTSDGKQGFVKRQVKVKNEK